MPRKKSRDSVFPTSTWSSCTTPRITQPAPRRDDPPTRRSEHPNDKLAEPRRQRAEYPVVLPYRRKDANETGFAARGTRVSARRPVTPRPQRPSRCARPCTIRMPATRALTGRGLSDGYRRTAVEHALAHIAARKGLRARHVGVRRNLFDRRRCAAIQNLESIHRLARAA
jgi:hypothetical protein